MRTGFVWLNSVVSYTVDLIKKIHQSLHYGQADEYSHADVIMLWWSKAKAICEYY